ncbi:hypothetical protein GTZ99_13010 [Novosphingobium sp. FSY-8]|uniref:Inner membrane protein n=1 Tax=Novosphingobium ovatum TaxID=1908523 RepID=A0ABW9XFY9_9SPHN|nr:hypothetical protein [Novosphingobium ovatum]NBC37468.1 hypothetical protein [Novosphingobium ovatum]
MIEEFPNQPRAQARSGCLRRTGVGLLCLGAILGGCLGLAYWNGGVLWLRGHLPAPTPAPVAAPVGDGAMARQAGLETRLATLEAKLTQITMTAATAADNAGRAESLLIAFATRRQIDRGAPLGYLEAQLKHRFGDTQGVAVSTLINAAHQPITRDRLIARLDALGPGLIDQGAAESTWSKIRRDLSGMFVLRKDVGGPAPDPRIRLAHARQCLQEGRVDDAIADIRLMPGAKAAEQWIADAHRYGEIQHALDIIETTALLTPAEQAEAARVAQPAPAPAAAVVSTTP